MQGDSTAARIRTFLTQHFPMTRSVSDEEPLLGNGFIDSLGILEVVTFLEREFGMSIADEELLPENFGSIASLSTFVERKRNGLPN